MSHRLATACAALSLTVPACVLAVGTRPADAAAKPSVITIGGLYRPTGFNNNTAEDNSLEGQAVVENLTPSAFISRGLTSPVLNRDLLVSAKLTGTNPERVTYQIRPGARWSDGVPIDVRDFVLQWKAQNGVDSRYASAGEDGYSDISSINGSHGGKTVTVAFKLTFVDWRSLFGDLMPAHLVHSPAQWNTGFDRFLGVSGGPLLMKSATASAITLVRNPLWYGRRAKVTEIVFRYFPTSAALAHAMATHTIDIAQPNANLSGTAELFGHVSGVSLRVTASAIFDHVDFNTHDPLFADISVRRAIALAFDPAAVAAVAGSGYGVTVVPTYNRLLITGQTGGTDNRGQYGHGDTAGAVSLLQSDGWARGSDGIFVRNGQRLSFALTTTVNPIRVAEANALAAQLAAAGIEMTVNPEPDAIREAIGHNFQAVLFAWVGSGEDRVSDQLDIYATGAGSNFGYVDDPTVDADLANAASDLNVTNETADLNAADRELWSDAVTLPLYQQPSLLAVADKIRGVRDETGGDSFTDGAAGWSIG